MNKHHKNSYNIIKKGKGEGEQNHKKDLQVTQRNKGSLKIADIIFVEKL